MDIDDFINLVRRMRQAQKDYFGKGRKQSDLIEAKKLEKEVDQALAKIANETPDQDDYQSWPMFPEEV